MEENFATFAATSRFSDASSRVTRQLTMASHCLL